jgi:5-methylcytosine-specific restriction endonuclease McrA
MARKKLTPKQRRRYKARQRAGGRCSYCKKPLPLREGTIDHWVPRSAGGTRRHSNGLWACLDCNRAKGHAHPLFIALLAKELHP